MYVGLHAAWWRLVLAQVVVGGRCVGFPLCVSVAAPARRDRTSCRRCRREGGAATSFFLAALRRSCLSAEASSPPRTTAQSNNSSY